MYNHIYLLRNNTEYQPEIKTERRSHHSVNSKEISMMSSSDLNQLQTYAPDDILDKLGSKHPLVIRVVLLTSFIWAISAPNAMSPAFIAQDCRNCSNTYSIIDEFDLRDGKAYQADLSTSAFMVGNMIGGIIVLPLADRFGRRPVMLSSLFLATLAGLMAFFAPNIYWFAASRFLTGIFYTAGALSAWGLGYESVPIKSRYLFLLVVGVCWVFGYCCLTPIAYFSPTWRWIALWVSAPHLVMAVLCYFFVPESLHYLCSSNRHGPEVVKKWLQRADPKNKYGIAEIDPERIHGNEKKKIRESMRSILHDVFTKHRKFLMFTAVVAYLWICDTFIYYGLSLYSTRLAGNIYLNYFLMGIAELPANLLSPWLIENITGKLVAEPAQESHTIGLLILALHNITYLVYFIFGRRPVIGGTHLVAAAVFFGLLFIKEGTWVALCLCLLGKSAISLSFMGIYVYASEIFPTNIRNFCIGFGEFLSRFGGMAASGLGPLGRINVIIPMIVLSVCSLIAGLITFLLPETLGKKLPATVKEAVEKRE